MVIIYQYNLLNEKCLVEGLFQAPPWWRHQMEIFSALLALCVGNSPVTGEFPSQRLVTRSFGVFFDLRLNKGLSKQSLTQNTASAPSHPIQHPTAGMGTHMTPVGCVMAGCCQINYILTNIGRRNSIRIFNQHLLFWNILIWTEFICFINLFAF